MANKTSLSIVGLFAVLTGIIYFGEAPERILGTSNAIKNAVNAVPFSVARGTTTTHFQDDGQVSYQFHAARLEHYREEDDPQSVFTLIEQPQLVIYDQDEPWYVSAEKGKITAVDQHIELWSEVLLDHTSAEGVKTTITTTRLTIDPVNKLANTQEPVKISAEDALIEGVGMDADLVAEKLTLLSSVRGQYDPN